MTDTMLDQELIDLVLTLSPEKKRQVLEYAREIKRPKGEPGHLFLERTKDIHFDPEDLEEMARAIEEDSGRVDLNDWELPS